MVTLASLRITCVTACAAIQIVVTTACYWEPHPERSRRFPTEQVAVDHLRIHRDAYRALADAWLASGNKQVYWFGLSNFNQEMYTWNDYWIGPKWWWWEVMHWDGRQYIVQRAATFEETARISGTSAEEVSAWRRSMEALGVDEIERVSANGQTGPFTYVEIGHFPHPIHPWGFRYAPVADRTAQIALQSWARRAPPRGSRMHDLGDGWFYYEGLWRGGPDPFERKR
jgi:hypothetical protein